MANSLLQQSDLEYMRTQSKLALPDLVSVQRKTLTADQQGGFTEAYSNVYSNIYARLTAKGGAKSSEAGRQDLQADYTLTVAHDQSIDQTDRVVHSSGTYEVLFVDAGDSWGTAKQCQVRQL